LVEAFRAFLVSPDANMIALLDGRGIGFDSPIAQPLDVSRVQL